MPNRYWFHQFSSIFCGILQLRTTWDSGSVRGNKRWCIINCWSLGGAIAKEYKSERFQQGCYCSVDGHCPLHSLRLGFFSALSKHLLFFVSSLRIMLAVGTAYRDRIFQNNSQVYLNSTLKAKQSATHFEVGKVAEQCFIKKAQREKNVEKPSSNVENGRRLEENEHNFLLLCSLLCVPVVGIFFGLFQQSLRMCTFTCSTSVKVGREMRQMFRMVVFS